MKPGFHNLTNEEYHQHPALGSSGLKEFARSPHHYAYHVVLEPEPPTPAQLFGQAYHWYNLEFDKFLKSIAVFEGVRRGKKWDEFQGENGDKIVLKPEEVAQIESLADVLRGHEIAASIVNHPNKKVEQSGFWHNDTFGIDCKFRPDIIIPELRVLADLKSTVDASLLGFNRARVNYKYHWQAAWHLAGMNALSNGEYWNTFLFICQEKAPPYAVAVYRASQEMLDTARSQIRPLVERYAECRANNKWPGYSDDVVDLELMPWEK